MSETTMSSRHHHARVVMPKGWKPYPRPPSDPEPAPAGEKDLVMALLGEVQKQQALITQLLANMLEEQNGEA